MSSLQSLRQSASGALPSFISKPLGLYQPSATALEDDMHKIFALVDYLRLPSLKGSSWTMIAFTVLSIVATILILEQANYRSKKAHLPGPTWTIPVIGQFMDSLHPTLENYMKGWNSGPLSVASVFNIFIVVASSNEHTRKILNSPTYAEPCLVASAKKVLCPDNWVFLNGKVHVDYRKGLNTLFTRKALSIYLPIQEDIYKRYFQEWMDDPNPNPQPYMMQFRDLNMETSLRVFCGNYISPEGAKQISDNYWLITVALELVNFPFALPGTKVYNAIKARKTTMRWFEHTARESKKRMAEGGEVMCLTDAWVKAMLDAREQKENADLEAETRRVLVRDFSDREIAMVILSFLFASQDAMSSGLTYLFQHVADRPDILRKVREEQYRVRGDDIYAPLTLDMLDAMPYTRMVVKESLRLKPPVIMVPYLTHKAFPIDKNYTAPKGTMVIPSFWNSLHDPTAYPDPEQLKPERWLEGPESPAEKNPKNYLVFGSGPHNCIGHNYAQLHLAAVLGTASVRMNWEHEVTDFSEKVKVIATIFPQDGARIKFTRRAAPAPGTAPEVAAQA
ncbi:putative ERG5-C-22 sterol desaturase [Tilletiaria anomala UBC 951]|uniref:sterol 22-desaturase n=1 Tax=Tilletiaria anomala (strain ATCC 24038 / CBS 436.72 / UBC 951) TaxID=1037660 RepID=A0A066WSC9_TILAU|nr:putative ERG5-C-22 sterol desaturase [Tilletiaria anomala UBC 951]KDN53595.1 putative ERG5-C-22 sterol desaturase [Tilletiaria anomala UBC 951]